MKTFIGVDYHKHYSFGTIMSEDGTILKQGRFNSSAASVSAFIAGFGGSRSSAVLEAGRNSCVMYDLLSSVVETVKLANPYRIRLIADSSLKTDKVDSIALANLLRMGFVPESYLPAPANRQIKNLVRLRLSLVSQQTAIKNRINTLIDRYPELRLQWRSADLFSQAGIAWLQQVIIAEQERFVLDSELAILSCVRQKIKETDRRLETVKADDHRLGLLRTLPGVGKVLSIVLLSEIDTITRFRNARKLKAYAGIVPSTSSSGGKTYNGRPSRATNKQLRWAVVEAAWAAIKKDSGLRVLYENHKRRKNANKAIVVVANRLLTIVYRMLSQNRSYKLCY